MRHAVLGAGGVGGLVGGALARAGLPVILIVRNPGHPARLRVESNSLGSFEVPVDVATRLVRDVDILWVTVKATQLDAALASAPADRVKGAVYPLLNGIDHMQTLRAVYPNVGAGALGGESERIAPGRIVQPSPMLWIQLAGPRATAAVDDLQAAGFNAAVQEDESLLLWRKLAILAPMALNTTYEQATVGELRADPEKWARVLAVLEEVAAVANALGIPVAADPIKQAFQGLNDDFRTSMQKDRTAGRPLEVEHIAGPVIRSGRERGVATPVTEFLASQLGAAKAL